jgi:multidrug efflux pump subunit AcrB
MAMLACVAVMPFFDVALQTISIASLIISLGILVDNGVVVSEDILVRLASGQERDTAVTRAVSELWKPLLAASLTTIFAFLPIPLAQSTTGEYTGSLFIVVSLTLLASWLLSMSLVPMLAHRFLKARITAQDFSGRAYRVYRGLLMACLRHRAVFLVLAVAVLAGAFWTMRHVPSMFFPPNERNMFIIDFWQPYGTDIRVTEERAAALEDFLLAQEAVDSTGVFVGTGGPRWYLPLSLEEDNRNYAFLVVNTRTVEDVEPVMRRTRAHAAEHFPDARATVKELMHGPPVGAPIQIRLSGEDIPTLYRLRERVGAMLEGTEGVSHVWDDWGQWTKKLVVDVNQDQARRVGLSSYDIALSLQAQMSGVTASQFREGDDLIPIVVRSQEAFREDLGRIEGLNVYSYQEGTSVPLLQVARTRLEWQPPNIRRRDQQRTITVKAEVRGRFASAVLADVRPQLEQMQAGQDWPMGYRVDYGGEFEESSQANASIMALVPLAMGLLVLVLVSQFNSLRRPAIILLTIPFMFAGIAPGMLLTNSPFGFMALLGVISLTGIIVNNAIMLIDRVESLAAEGHVRREAVVLSAMQRARPILMTTVTTIVGMIPLSLQGGEMWRPMANCIISGLAVSTLLTLLLCPVLYSLFFRLRYRDYRWDPAAARGQ